MRNKRDFWIFFSVLLGLAGPAVGQSAPLSAIDWLSQSVVTSPNASVSRLPIIPGEPPVTAGGALPKDVSMSVLGAPSLDGIGILPATTSGFPTALWGQARAADILPAIARAEVKAIPALQSLLITLLLAESNPPVGGTDRVLLARIDKLLEIGALDQAYALIEAAGITTNADLFRRAFDVSLLTGEEDRACRALKSAPSLSPAPPARIFCAARNGDWLTANLTLRTESSLGAIGPIESALLARFLDPESGDLPAPPKPITPLKWRIFDALGETIPTATLPLAFSHAELSQRAGWKAQIEAAERLARADVLAPNQLLGLYTDRVPAASGGVWDRVDAFQRFEAALAANDPIKINSSLPRAYMMMKTVELEVPFAALFAEALSKQPLTGQAAEIAYELGLLSAQYERLSDTADTSQRQVFLARLARGNLQGIRAPDSMARAIAPAFLGYALPDDLTALVTSGQVGLAILAAIDRINQGVLGEDRAITEGLALLRVLGLDSVARRTGLELMILERRG